MGEVISHDYIQKPDDFNFFGVDFCFSAAVGDGGTTNK